MKNDRGFTLVEMLGTLIILIVVFMIVAPLLTKVIKDTNEEIDNATITVIEDATTDFLSEKNDIYPKNNDYTYCITLEQLLDNGNLTDTAISSLDYINKFVKTTFKDGKNIYNITDTCTVSKPSVEFVLIDDNNMSFEVGIGGQYVEPGATAKNKAGEVVSYVTTITNKDKVTVAYVDTTKIGIYTIKYSSTIDGKDYAIERIVKVIDTTAPTITVTPTTETISITNNTYNVLNGITASDNSGVTPKIRASTNLSLGQPGTYAITYTATDSSGNKKTSKRTVVISNLFYANGTVVYFNPVTGVKCTSGQSVNTASNTSTVDMILDHNTTALVAWNSSGSNVSGPTNVLAQLLSDTSSWTGVPTRIDSYGVNNGTANYTINYSTYKARLITAADIAKITGNTSFDETSALYTELYYFDSNNQTPIATGVGTSNFSWLYNYTNECTSYGCNIADASTYGYWTATAIAGDSINAWNVDTDGDLDFFGVQHTYGVGVRPVITISKSLVN